MSNIKKIIATYLFKATTGIAKTSTTMSPNWIWSEPKLPEILLKK